MLTLGFVIATTIVVLMWKCYCKSKYSGTIVDLPLGSNDEGQQENGEGDGDSDGELDGQDAPIAELADSSEIPRHTRTQLSHDGAADHEDVTGSDTRTRPITPTNILTSPRTIAATLSRPSHPTPRSALLGRRRTGKEESHLRNEIASTPSNIQCGHLQKDLRGDYGSLSKRRTSYTPGEEDLMSPTGEDETSPLIKRKGSPLSPLSDDSVDMDDKGGVRVVVNDVWIDEETSPVSAADDNTTAPTTANTTAATTPPDAETEDDHLTLTRFPTFKFTPAPIDNTTTVAQQSSSSSSSSGAKIHGNGIDTDDTTGIARSVDSVKTVFRWVENKEGRTGGVSLDA